MKLICIYGPPAVGKLTVAKQLSKLTKFNLFHNQLSVDLVSSILGWKNMKANSKIKNKIRLELLEEAARQNINGVIFTFCYAYKKDDGWVKKLISKIKKHNGQIYFVHLTCEKEALSKRVKEESRKEHKKIKHKKDLKKILNKFELFTPMPFTKSLEINNSKISAKKVAEIIQKEFKL